MSGARDDKGPEDGDDAGESGALATGLAVLSGVGAALLGAMQWPARGVARVFAALKHRWFAALWSAALISNIGSLVQQVAVSWLAYELSHSELVLGMMGVASQAPQVALLPVGGVLADLIDRRRILLVGNAILAMTAALLAALAWWNQLQVWHLMAIAIVNGAVAAMLIPAQQSITPRLVPMSDLPNAIALNGMQFNLSRLIGPAIGGVVLAGVGAAAAFGVNAVSFLPLLLVALLLPAMASEKRVGGRGARLGLLDGWHYLATRPDLIVIAVTFFIVGLVASPVLQMLPAYVKLVYAGDANAFARLFSGFGAGAALGAATIAATSRRTIRPWAALPAYAVVGALVASLALRPSYPTALAIMVGIGGLMVASNNRIFAAAVASTPDDVRGRVCSIQAMAFSAGLPIGSLIAGVVAEHFGAPAAFAALGLGSTVLFLATVLWVRLGRIVYQAPAGAAGQSP